MDAPRRKTKVWLTSHRGALVQLLDLPLQLLDPTLSLAGMYITILSTCRTGSLGGCRGIRHSRASSNESGGRERRGGRSGHDNMGVYPEIFRDDGVRVQAGNLEWKKEQKRIDYIWDARDPGSEKRRGQRGGS